MASVSGEAIENIPVPTFEQALQGRATGVFIESNNGKLGQGIKVRVRGASSVTASNQPLYVVDGIPITSQSQADSDSETNPLADINFNDVASIEILKDASAAAIYGSRASNGVVLITTKRGKEGRTNFKLNAYTGFNEPTNRREFLSTEEYVELFTEAALNSEFDLDREYIEGQFTRYGAGNEASWLVPGAEEYVNTNWQDEVFQRGAISQIDLSASGGSEKTTFYASGSYSDQNGLIKTNQFTRISGRLNLDHQATDKLKFGLNFNLARSKNNRVPNDNAFSTPLQIIALPPMTPPVDPRTGELSGNYTLYYNPLLNFAHSSNVATVLRNISNLYATYEIAPSLSFRTEYGIDLLTQNEEQYFGQETARNSSAPNGLGFNRWVQVANYTTNNFFQYTKSFAEIHNIDAVFGMSYQQSTTDATEVEGREFPSNAYRQIVSAADITGGESTESGFSFLSYFAQANYKLRDRYLFSVSGRVDGSSRFGANNRYGFFPAASAGWILTEEAFMNDSELLSFLKLRASYGLTGNAEILDAGLINNFAALGLYTGEGGYAGVPGQRPTQIANPDLRWEQTAQFDIGIDFGLFDDRLTGEIDYYNKDTRDLLLNVNIPATTGFESQLQNVGRLQNSGFEFALYSQNTTGDFQWSTNFNFARNINQITDLQGQVIEGGFVNRAVEGEPIGVFFAPEYAGVDPANGDALYYLNTENADGSLNRETTNNVNLAQRVVIGNPNPDFIGGITNDFAYMGFELNVFFQGVFGNEIYNGGGKFQSANADYFDNQTRDQLRRWQNPGDITDVPQARLFGGNGTAESSRYVQDGSYVRLKTVTLGYNFPVSLLERLNLTSLKVYASGQNLLTFTDYTGWDPEVNTDYLAGNISQGNDFYSAPQARTITFGVNLGF
ncbi:SusC/RagA family TonB-linked outer membrane protein [Catalinimonas niigatensis]|uniref:SusC/RagA family TonB-linked outer membrane protein n=1 Tax=Catalinimonas niigatensis TaxID=1397264 RepID=UPI002AA2B3C8|nr:TonB-dependent receptor [Catalinimonas niigatensis]WPP53698.1 TonB-dependent receptor [Catalinimonas niigatensis]